MTEKQAYELSLKLWIWLFKNPGETKSDSPFWNKIANYKSSCPLCEYYKTTIGHLCENCILHKWKACFLSGAYNKWADDEYHKSAAAYIASKIRRYIKKKGWLIDEK